MATPIARPFELAGAPPVRGTVRAAAGPRPAVVACGAPARLAERLARAGFAAVTFDEAAGFDPVLRALAAGALGAVPTAVGLWGAGAGALAAVRRAAADPAARALVTWGPAPHAELPAAWLRLDDPADEETAITATVSWFTRQLA